MLLFCFFCSLCLPHSVHPKSMAAGRLENVTQTISRILEGYDIRLRPNFGGEYGGPLDLSLGWAKTKLDAVCTCLLLGEPLHVGMDLTIASFDAISEVNMVSESLQE